MRGERNRLTTTLATQTFFMSHFSPVVLARCFQGIVLCLEKILSFFQSLIMFVFVFLWSSITIQSHSHFWTQHIKTHISIQESCKTDKNWRSYCPRDELMKYSSQIGHCKGNDEQGTNLHTIYFAKPLLQIHQQFETTKNQASLYKFINKRLLHIVIFSGWPQANHFYQILIGIGWHFHVLWC